MKTVLFDQQLLEAKREHVRYIEILEGDSVAKVTIFLVGNLRISKGMKKTRLSSVIHLSLVDLRV